LLEVLRSFGIRASSVSIAVAAGALGLTNKVPIALIFATAAVAGVVLGGR
jgi:hypothetical protein